jgi:hypothetical protein
VGGRGAGGRCLTLEKRGIGRSKDEYAESVYSPKCVEEEFSEVALLPLKMRHPRLCTALRVVQACQAKKKPAKGSGRKEEAGVRSDRHVAGIA